MVKVSELVTVVLSTYLVGSLSFNILDTSRYLPLDEQYHFLKTLARKADGSMKLEVIGDTYMPGKDYKNDVYLVTFGTNTDHVIFFDCGMHAREWISSATCLYLIQKLAGLFSNKKSKSNMKNYQWKIIPMANPDGYAITHKGPKYRMYRKNARPFETMNITEAMKKKCGCYSDPERCRGVDPNRNFPAGWRLGSKKNNKDSQMPCKMVYAGSHPLSEPESKIINKVISSLGTSLIGAMSIHSFGRCFYYSKGWLPADDPNMTPAEDVERLRDFANAINKRLHFRIGTVYDLDGANGLSGGATDDFYYSKGINVSYTIELYPGWDDKLSHYGFQLPAVYISEVGSRMWSTLGYMASKFDEYYPEAARSAAAVAAATRNKVWRW